MIKVSSRVARFLKRMGYNVKTIDEYWLIDDTLHSYLEGELKNVKPELRISAPSPYEALSWLWEKKQVGLNLMSENKCVCSASIPHKKGMIIEISGEDPDRAMYNCLELIAHQW